METETLPPSEENHTQSDFIQKELNFDVDPDDPLTKASLSDHPVNEWMDILGNGQLRKKVLKAGKENSRPNRSDVCVLKFTGRLEDGTIVEEEEDIKIQLGDMEVIQGLDLAVALMDLEEEAEVETASRFAYGSLGRKATASLPEIPPDAKITYNIVLKSIEFEPDIDELEYSERQKIGNKKRERGNWWFARNESTLAIHCYRKALEYLSPSNDDVMAEKIPEKKVIEPTDAELQALLEDALKVHNNLAAAQLKCEAYDAALKSVENVLRCQPHNVKALFRKGKILHYKGEHAKACATLSQASKIEPDNKAILQELSILKKKTAKDARHEKNLYRKMLGATPDNKQNNVGTASSNKKTPAKLTWSLAGGTLVAVAGLIAYRFAS
ncbi:peptidyl-prolyl cis-trans isomerase FKBP8 [Nasonia vitripennis]|uniref:peptidylprolyl isomerase n=1 Tax=Nasonia vitripennis TaxID=7425 RepID=A0A7M7H695_NASVI|nr:peptidyl-prolyl cis-trans isomerase FKBP8 [Nasonia vitripennis]XP_008210401.1 peptidyl-prolyl cis-trans isomerase FKBP8 [Nasonia vitripennis]XP_008210402.1 peptidyl-prolyl cis-trans isomerase FKBP8 [Nasonia vitripennis]XP_008210403.1 peptidyl-prolyl cis-trans isomerase FKBP8 [Nasonia vitripennis]XP_016838944.1 peptidyl-prolyl cis-trans isomerase FKBP8 [Nasonia vitripennis]XP_032453929.1 peptidyl-prolyl cis-trans isomerase FKBP8 [Nasonia vitripennis]